MSLTIQVPPAMEQEAIAYAEMRGTTLEAILFECLRREMDARREREQRISDFESFVDSHSVDLGHSYKFSRQDAYDEGEDLNPGQIYCGMVAINPFASHHI